jgi:SAM-dependent methyltransferase
MSATLAIPDKAVKYILFQRTAYLVLERQPFFRFINKYSPIPAFNVAVGLESTLRSRQVKRDFANDMLSEYKDIREWLPERCERMLDIGCGVAGIDALVYQHYADRHAAAAVESGDPSPAQGPQIELLDKTLVEDKVFYGFKRHGAFYNSLRVAADLLIENGVPADTIRLWEVGGDSRIETESGLDLIISLISWGYHYPVSVYLEQVVDKLRPGGCLIMDVRKGTEGLDALAQAFRELRTISASDTQIRIRAIK